MPTVDDALEARDAARYSRYPPTGRRSSGGGSFGQVWPGINYRATINDNMLVTVMIETLEGVANAEEIAATQGVDAVILGCTEIPLLLRDESDAPDLISPAALLADAAVRFAIL